MIPMTVSYFLRGSKSRAQAVTQALVFGLSIVFLYTMIGVLVAVFKNTNAVNNFTTHWITNLVFFLIFMTLAASFFGMFEIMLPTGLANKVDKQADRGGYIGAFFMALAMAILSFSCTGPIVASLLIKASQGDVLEPVVGMAGFSIVFALPFTLFAIFPTWLKGLPKSGGWLNSVKVVFAFIMLAFALYFVGKIDQTYHLNLLGRPLYLSIWVVIFTLLGLYLLGMIRFAHDDEIKHVGFFRLLFALAGFSFALYLATGLWGNELKSLSPVLPPPSKAPVTSSAQQTGSLIPSKLCSTPRFADFLELPEGYEGYFDYTEALACAKQQNKPVLVEFGGHTCSNCKKMYGEVWTDPRVRQLLNEKFIIAALYTDDRTELPEKEWVTSKIDGKVKNTIGKINQDLQISKFGSNALPLYAIVDPDGNIISSSMYTYSPDVERFILWLNM
jgi:thiol:disulfide interchange protein DsbD